MRPAQLRARVTAHLKAGKVNIELPIVNINRVVGTMLSHQVVDKYGANGLDDDTIHIKAHGLAVHIIQLSIDG